MCTSLLYRDAANRAYLGRTLELTIDLPYLIAYSPAALDRMSEYPGHPALAWRADHAFVAVTMPDAVPAPGVAPGPADLKVIEGVNDAGLTFSVQSYAAAGGPAEVIDSSLPVLSAADLGAWALGRFTSVEEVRAALESQPVLLPKVPILGGIEMPFHYCVRDATGASLVIEFHHGVRALHDNPVGVMTNAPRFDWHLTNLDNYTFLDNVDRAKASFGAYEAVAPGSGIAKAGLPATDTSPDRFVRAAFYAQFAEKQSDPDQSVRMVAHLMNNFDRPRGVTVDPPASGVSHLRVDGVAPPASTTEFTSWTSLTDLDRRLLFLRGPDGMNYTRFDLGALAAGSAFVARPMGALLADTPDSTAALRG